MAATLLSMVTALVQATAIRLRLIATSELGPVVLAMSSS